MHRGQRSEGRGQRSEVRSQKSEDRGQKSEVRSQKSEVRRQRTEVRGQKSEVRGQKSEVRGQMAAEREQRLEGRAHSAWGTGFRNEASLFFCIQFYDSWLRELPQEIRSDLQRLSQQARSLGRLAETTVHIPHCAATGSSCSMRSNRFLVL